MSLQTVIAALEKGDYDTIENLKIVRQLKAVLIEVGLPNEHGNIVCDAKKLWNAVVMHDSTSSITINVSELLCACRELALLIISKYLITPWDDKATLMIFEMNVRTARAFEANVGQARLYISKATELKETLENSSILSPSLEVKYQDILCLFYIELLRAEISHGSCDSLAQHHHDQAFANINEEHLSKYIIELVNLLSKHKDRKGLALSLVEKAYSKIRSIETFPAHISEDVLVLLLDLHISNGTDMAKIEKTVEHINPSSPAYVLAKLKVNLMNSEVAVQNIAQLILKSMIFGRTLRQTANLVLDCKGKEFLGACLEELSRMNMQSVGSEIKAEFVELSVERMLHIKITLNSIREYLVANLEILRGADSRQRIQKWLCETGERFYQSENFQESYECFSVALVLHDSSNDLDKKNKPKIERKMVMCLLEVEMLDDAETIVFEMPSDQNGTMMRFLLAVCRGQESDSVSLLERLIVFKGVDLNQILCLANFCMKRSMPNVLLQILQHALKLAKGTTIQNDILKAIISTAYVSLPNISAKVEILCEYLMLAEKNLIDNPEFYVKIGWNTLVDAVNAEMHAYATVLGHLIFRMIQKENCRDKTSGQLKINSLLICLRSLVEVRNADSDALTCKVYEEKYSLLQEIKQLVDDIELTAVFLPPVEKRGKELFNELRSALSPQIDPLKTLQEVTILEFKLSCIESDLRKCRQILSTFQTSLDYEDLEKLAVWCVSNSQIDAGILLDLLQILVDKLIRNEEKNVDFVRFAFIYRGMAIVSLTKEYEMAYQYFRQALDICKAFPEYPKDEICWLAVASYNHALGRSLIDVETAQRWCELSLSFCNHMGHHRTQYEQTIRAGYSKILKRLTAIEKI